MVTPSPALPDLHEFISKIPLSESTDIICQKLKDKLGVTAFEDLIDVKVSDYATAEIKLLDRKKIRKALFSYRIKPCEKEGEIYQFLDKMSKIIKFAEGTELISQKLAAGGFETVKSLFYADVSGLETDVELKKEDAMAIKAATNTDSLEKKGINPMMLLSEKHKPALYAMLLEIIEKVQSIDICIVLDITGSMDRYLSMVKEVLHKLLKSIKETNKLLPRFGFVGYRDYGDDPEFEVHDFTSSADDLIAYLDNVRCTGGDDIPEDIRGALAVASSLSWGNNMKMVLLIADAPPHGSIYHDPSMGDDYNDDHLKMVPTLDSILDYYTNRIHLLVFKCNDRVDIMCEKFRQRLKANNWNFIDQDIASKEAVNLLEKFLSNFKESMKASLKFGKYKATPGTKKAITLSLGDYTIDTEISMLLRPVRVTSEPDFKSLIVGEEMKGATTKEFSTSKFGMKFEVEEKSSSGAKAEMAFTISMGAKIESGTFRNAVPMRKKTVKEGEEKKVSKEGEEKKVSKEGEEKKADSEDKYMIKLSKTPGEFMTVDSIKKELATYVISAFLAGAFNKALEYAKSKLKPEFAGKTIELLQCYAGEAPPGKEEKFPFIGNKFALVEKFLDGEYKKFNNNFGWVSEEEAKGGEHSVMYSLAQAFSHWSYEYTCGIYLVVDIQGTHKGDKLYLTDPAIHSSFYASDFGDTNCGKFGFAKFFLTHVCNEYCTALGLFPPHRVLNASDTMERESYIKAAENMRFKPLIEALRKPKGEVEESLPINSEIQDMVKKAKIKKEGDKK